MIRRRRQAFTIGVLVLAIGGTAVAVSGMSLDPFAAKPVVVYADFANANGIARKGVDYLSDVRVAGVKVGKVQSFERRGSHARLTLEIADRDVAQTIRQDATAELRPRTPFEGNSFIDLHVGTGGAPRLHGAIPVSQTRNYVPFLEALSFARQPVRADAQTVIRKATQTLAPDTQRGLERSLRRLPQLSRDLARGAQAFNGPRGDELTGTLRGAAKALSAVAERERRVVPFLRGAGRTFAGLNTDGGRPLDTTLRTLPHALGALTRGGHALASTLDRLDTLAGDLRAGLRALPATLRETRPLLREARPALARTVPLVANLRPALAAGARSTRRAQTLLRATLPTFRLLNDSLLPALQGPTPIGLPAYLAAIGVLQGAAAAFSPFQTEADSHQPGQLGAGHFARFEGYFYSALPSSGSSPALPSCAVIPNPALANRLKSAGVCQ